MARYKDFGAPVGADSDEPITFTLYGETFRCRPALQGRVLIKFIAESTDEDPSAGARALLKFFKEVIVTSDYERFENLTEGESTIVPMEVLSEIMEWMVEQYTARPTQQQPPLESGDVTTGTTFAGVPSSPQESVSVS